MSNDQENTETITRFPRPKDHFVFLMTIDGDFLLSDEKGELAATSKVSDAVVWRQQGEILRHYLTDKVCEVIDRSLIDIEIVKGPELLPSEYLRQFRLNGWVCLPDILDAVVVDNLQRVACTDDYSEFQPDTNNRQLCQSDALVKAAVEPLSLWLSREYMGTSEVRLAHTPGIGVLTPDDGKRVVQGWHSDYPYHWGIDAAGKVPTPSGPTVMGVQRIICISEFTRHSGATAFKLGSHTLEKPPPEQWGLAQDAYHPKYRSDKGLPYGGADADVIEAPAGSVILFDTRTWHRAGINRSNRGRAAMLMDTTPAYIIPYSDTSQDYKALVSSDIYGQLNQREKTEIDQLMVHRFLGPAGPRSVIGTDIELTEQLSPNNRQR